MFHYFILDKDNNVVVADLMSASHWMEDNQDRRRVASTVLSDCHVSTVFLCINHQWDRNGPPLVFETMVFGGPSDGEYRRYATWDEAVKGHEEMVLSLCKQGSEHEQS